jgi:hypothetical protein
MTVLRLAVLTASVLALLAATASASTKTAECKGSQLSGTFNVVRGSAGAGNITYALRLRNVSTTECTVTGLPFGRLLGRKHNPLATHVKAAFPQGLTAILVRLQPGQWTRATARFSPDVPGTGEPAAGNQCEPTSYYFRVNAQGGGTSTVKLGPVTPVCEHGQLLFSAYGR